MIIEQNASIIGKDIAENAVQKVKEETKKRKGRPKKQTLEEGGTKENEQEEKTRQRRVSKSA